MSFIFILLLHDYAFFLWLRGVTVAREIPNLEVACSSHVVITKFVFLDDDATTAAAALKTGLTWISSQPKAYEV